MKSTHPLPLIFQSDWFQRISESAVDALAEAGFIENLNDGEIDEIAGLISNTMLPHLKVAGEYPSQQGESQRLEEWRKLSDSGLRLRLGEMTAQEIRTVRAVLNAISRPVTSKL